MRQRNRRLLELSPQACESNRWHWLDELTQTRAPTFIDSVARGPLGTSWVFLCEASGLQDAGEFFSDEIAGVLVVVCRNRTGVLKGLYNVCPHLGAPVVRDRHGQTRSFICPYHGWVFSLDGSLTGVPFPEGYDESGFRKEDFSMPPVHVTHIGGLVFGSLSERPADPIAYFAAATPYLESVFPSESQWDIILNCSVRVDLSWEEWMTRSRRAYADGGVAEALTGLSQADYCHSREVVQTPHGHQITRLQKLDLARLGHRYGLTTRGWEARPAKSSQEQGWAGCVLHLAPNLLVAGVGDALVTVRADPIDEHCTLLRIRGYGRRGERPELRQARRQQLQLWWGPASEQLQRSGQ